MPIVNNPVRRMGNKVVTELIDSVGTSEVTYTLNSQQDTITIQNLASVDLVVSVGTQLNINVLAFRENTIIERHTEFKIKSKSGHGSFRATASYKDVDEEDEKDLSVLTNSKDYIGYGEISLPADFVPTLPFTLYRDLDGKIKHNYNFTQFETYTKVFYVDSAVGGDGNNGDSATPFKTVKKALQMASLAVETDILIRVKGIQLRGYGGDDGAFQAITTLTNKRVSIIPDGSGKIVLANAQSSTHPTLPLTWTADGSAWKTTRSSSWNAFDLKNRDVFGVAKPLEYVTSVTSCQTTPNSWYTDNTTVWVNTYNGRQPDGDVLVCVSVSAFWVKLVNSTIYMRDLEFYSGFLGDAIKMYGSCFIEGDATSKIIDNKCIFAGGEARDTGANIPFVNGLQFLNTKEVYSFNGVAAYTRRDGFNYHYYTVPEANRRQYLAFEYECIAYETGRYDANTNNNATTCHEGVSVLRVNSKGYNTKGPVLADVNGCYSILYDNGMNGSKLAPTSDLSSAYYFDNLNAPTPGKALLINCEGGSPKYSIFGETDFDVRVRNFKGKKVKSDVKLSYLD